MDLTNLPMQAPNMGEDYGSLANSLPSSAVVPGGNPAGNIGTAGQAQMLGQQARMKMELMQKASGLADIQAQLKTQQAGEYMAGAPGRSADIDVANKLAASKLGGVDSLVQTQSNDEETKLLQSKQKKVQAELDKIQPYANLWVNAPDKQSRDLIKEKMKEDGLSKVGNKSIDDLSDSQIDNLMNASRNSAVFTPEQVGKERIANINSTAKVESSYNQAQGRIGAAQVAAKVKEWITQNPQMVAGKNPDQIIFNQILQQYGMDAASNWYQQEQIERRRAGTNQPSQLDFQTDQSGAISGVTPRPPVSARPIPMPGPMAPPQGQMGQPPQQMAPPPSAQGPVPAQAALSRGMPVTGGPPQLGGPGMSAPPPQAPSPPPPPPAAPKVMPEAQALEIVKAAKGTANFEKYKAYFKKTYGRDPNI